MHSLVYIFFTHLQNNFRAQLVNIDAGFVQTDGTILHHDMHDYLHLTQKGYDKAFEPVNELLLQLLSESEDVNVRTEAEGAAD
jgi:platelet-activating factor acetylhydrolase IB subunit beta/gamma